MFGMTKTITSKDAHGFQQRLGIYVWAGIVDGRLIVSCLLRPA